MPRRSEFSTFSWTSSVASGLHSDSPNDTTLSASAASPFTRDPAFAMAGGALTRSASAASARPRIARAAASIAVR
jgi:hypothetical protein